MFYWSHKDVYIVLTDDEELALVQPLLDRSGPCVVLKLQFHRLPLRPFVGVNRLTDLVDPSLIQISEVVRFDHGFDGRSEADGPFGADDPELEAVDAAWRDVLVRRHDQSEDAQHHAVVAEDGLQPGDIHDPR